MVQLSTEILVGTVGVGLTLTALHLFHYLSLRSLKSGVNDLVSKFETFEKLAATVAVCSACKNRVTKFKKGEDGLIRCANCLFRHKS